MKIITYQSAEAPPNIRWMAVYLDGGGLLPVRFTGSDEAVVREAAQTFWDAEQQKIIDKGLKAQARKAPKDPPAQFEEEAV